MDAETHYRFLVESERNKYPEKALEVIYKCPGRATGQSFIELYDLRSRPDLYHLKLRQLAREGQYPMALSLLAELGVVHEEYLCTVIFPTMLSIDTCRSHSLTAYLKANPEVAEKVEQLLLSAVMGSDVCSRLIGKHGLHLSDEDVSQERLRRGIKWINGNILKRPTCQPKVLKNLYRLCDLKKKFQIQSKDFFSRTDKLMIEHADLVSPLMCRLIDLEMYDVTFSVAERYRVNLQKLPCWARERLEHIKQKSSKMMTLVVDEEGDTEATNDISYTMITTEDQFGEMLLHLRDSRVLAVTCRAERRRLCLLQIITQGRIFIVDTIVTQYSVDLRSGLVSALSGAELLIGNTKSEEFLNEFDFFTEVAAAAAGQPMGRLKVVNMVAFYAYIRGHPVFQRALQGSRGQSLETMEDVVWELEGKRVNNSARFGWYSERPLLQVEVNYAAVQVLMVWNSFLLLKDMLSRQRKEMKTVLMEFAKATELDEVPQAVIKKEVKQEVEDDEEQGFNEDYFRLQLKDLFGVKMEIKTEKESDDEEEEVIEAGEQVLVVSIKNEEIDFSEDVSLEDLHVVF